MPFRASVLFQCYGHWADLSVLATHSCSFEKCYHGKDFLTFISPLSLFQEFLLFTFGYLGLILSFSFCSYYISVKLNTKLCPSGFFQSWKIWKYSAHTGFWLWVFQTCFSSMIQVLPGLVLKDMLTCREIPALPFTAHHQVSQHSGNDSAPGSHSHDKEMQLRHMNFHHTPNNETPIQLLLPWMPHVPTATRTPADTRGNVVKEKQRWKQPTVLPSGGQNLLFFAN